MINQTTNAIAGRAFTDLISTNIKADSNVVLKQNGRVGSQNFLAKAWTKLSNGFTFGKDAIRVQNQKTLEQLKINLSARGFSSSQVNNMLSSATNNTAIQQGYKPLQGKDIQSIVDLSKDLKTIEPAYKDILTACSNGMQSKNLEGISQKANPSSNKYEEGTLTINLIQALKNNTSSINTLSETGKQFLATKVLNEIMSESKTPDAKASIANLILSEMRTGDGKLALDSLETSAKHDSGASTAEDVINYLKSQLENCFMASENTLRSS